MKSVIVATSMGGPAVAEGVVTMNKQKGKRWNADRGGHDIGRLKVRLLEDLGLRPKISMEEKRMQTPVTPLVTTPHSAANSMRSAGSNYSGGGGLSTFDADSMGRPVADDVPLMKLKMVRRKPLGGTDAGYARLELSDY